MKSVIASLVAVAGMSVAANAVVNTNVTWQVSLDGNTWSSAVDAAAGQQVMARALVSYTGTAAPLGLASFVFQPTVSNALAGDTVSPFINGGVGSNTSTPSGVISGSQLTDTTSSVPSMRRRSRNKGSFTSRIDSHGTPCRSQTRAIDRLSILATSIRLESAQVAPRPNVRKYRPAALSAV